MKWLVIVVIACLLAGGLLTAWQLYNTYQAAVEFSNEVTALNAEIAAFEKQAIEMRQANIALSERVTELEAAQVETYFEGVWSLCMVFNAYIATGGGDEFVDCATIVAAGYDQDWHERDAPGFEWPPTSGD